MSNAKPIELGRFLRLDDDTEAPIAEFRLVECQKYDAAHVVLEEKREDALGADRWEIVANSHDGFAEGAGQAAGDFLTALAQACRSGELGK